MFNWLKRVFSKPEEVQVESEPRFFIKPCASCGKPITYNPAWKHIPNNCTECKTKYRADHDILEIICSEDRG